jgi:hypothetical protein
MQNQTNLLKVYSRKVALELRRLGYRILFTEPNENHPQFDVYVFENKGNVEKEMARIGRQIKEEKEIKK